MLPAVEKASQARGAQTNLRRHGGLVNTESSAVVLFLELTVSDGLVNAARLSEASWRASELTAVPWRMGGMVDILSLLLRTK